MNPEILQKLRCTRCPSEHLHAEAAALTCPECQTVYPLRDGRFPDFLSTEERQALNEELAFWASHFKDVEYQDESDSSYESWISLIGSTADQDVLEIGCGSGAMLRRMPAKTRVGLEPAANLLYPSHGFTGIIGTAHGLPFRAGSFDLVLYKHALHHVQDKHKALEESVRVLKPGGRIVVIEPNADHPQRRLISNPNSWLRKSHVFSRFIGPVETFQPLSQLTHWAQELGLAVEHTEFRESAYDRLTVRQGLQRIYSRLLAPVIPRRFLIPNYFAAFSKAM